MRFNQRYLPFSEEITPVIYQIIIAKLRSEGYHQEGGDKSYTGFRNTFPYLNIGEEDFIIQKEPEVGYSSIKITDILGPKLAIKNNIMQSKNGFIDGEFYCSLGNGDEKPIIFKRTDGRNAPFVSNRTNTFSKSNTCCENDSIFIRPAKKEEIELLNRCIAAGKYVSMETDDISVGQVIVCKDTDYDYVTPNYLYKVSKVSSSGFTVTDNSGRNNYYFSENPSHFRKATLEEARIYKIFGKPVPVDALDDWKNFTPGDCVVRIGTESNSSIPTGFIFKTNCSPDERGFITDVSGSINGFAGTEGRNYREFRLATKAESRLYRKTGKPVTSKLLDKEYLLKRAKELFPAGTRYHAAHLSVDGSSICTVSDPDKFRIIGDLDDDFSIIESSGDYKKNGHSYSEIICSGGEWAQKVGEETIKVSYDPSEHLQEEFKISDPVSKEPDDPLLEEIREKYPIGTYFRAVGYVDNIYQVRKPIVKQFGGYSHDGIGFVYYSGKWAEIVSKSDALSHNGESSSCDTSIEQSLDLSIKKVKKIEVEVPKKREIVLDLTIKNSRK